MPKRELVRRKHKTDPILAPTINIGLMGTNRKHLELLGGFDLGMDGYGAEDIEISFKVWQCHGKMLKIPCSNVGHIFRKYSGHKKPAGFD